MDRSLRYTHVAFKKQDLVFAALVHRNMLSKKQEVLGVFLLLHSKTFFKYYIMINTVKGFVQVSK